MTMLSSVFYFHVSLRKQPTFHEAITGFPVKLWQPLYPLEFLHLSLSHLVDKTSGGLTKCWLFSQAIFMLAKVLSYYERHNIYCCLTSSWFLGPWLPSSVLLTLLPVFSSAGAGIWCTQLLQERTTVVNIQSQRAKIWKSCLITQGWWILPSG